jgi:hypothetical protein
LPPKVRLGGVGQMSESKEISLREIELRIGHALITYIATVDLLRHTRPTHSQVYCHEQENTPWETLLVWDFVKWCDGDLEAGERLLQYNRQVMSVIAPKGPRIVDAAPLTADTDPAV